MPDGDALAAACNLALDVLRESIRALHAERVREAQFLARLAEEDGETKTKEIPMTETEGYAATHMYLVEALTKAEQGMGFVCTDLRAAVGEADAVTTVHLLELCEEANRLLARIAVVVEAMEAERITAKGTNHE